MLPEMVLFSLCHLVCQEHALFMFYHFQNDISKVLCFSTTGVLAWLEFVSKQVYCLVCVHFRQNIPFGQECLSFCLRSNASCSNCCFKEHYKKISLKGCQSSRFTQTRANTTTTKSTASRWIVWLFEKNKSKHCANFYFCNELKEEADLLLRIANFPSKPLCWPDYVVSYSVANFAIYYCMIFSRDALQLQNPEVVYNRNRRITTA